MSLSKPAELKALCDEILQLDAEAMAGPWAVGAGMSGGSQVFGPDGDSIVKMLAHGWPYLDPETAEIIASYRILAPQLARAVLEILNKGGGTDMSITSEYDEAKLLIDGTCRRCGRRCARSNMIGDLCVGCDGGRLETLGEEQT